MRIDYFLGIGQGEKTRMRLAKKFPKLRFHTAPNYLGGNNDTEFRAIGVEFVVRALEGATPIVLCAESQAAPAVVEAIVSGKITPPKRLVLIQPLGLNPDSLGGSRLDKRRELLHRSRIFWRQKNQSLFISGNRLTALTLFGQSAGHFWRLPGAYEFGASQDIRAKLVSLAESVEVMVFASDDDSLFPYSEILAENRNLESKMYELSSTHLNRSTPRGEIQLREILQKIQG